jgi:hypothetical protein
MAAIDSALSPTPAVRTRKSGARPHFMFNCTLQRFAATTEEEFVINDAHGTAPPINPSVQRTTVNDSAPDRSAHEIAGVAAAQVRLLRKLAESVADALRPAACALEPNQRPGCRTETRRAKKNPAPG